MTPSNYNYKKKTDRVDEFVESFLRDKHLFNKPTTEIKSINQRRRD